MYSNKKKINVGFPILANEKAPNVDHKYGLYSSKQEAFDYLGEDGLDMLCVGLTVGIMTENGVEEYWFKKACNSVDDLVPKTSSGYVVPEGETAENTPQLDSDKEVQGFLEGYNKEQKLADVIDDATKVADESAIAALFQ